MTSDAAVDLARPRPAKPEGVDLDDRIGRIGNPSSLYVKRLLDGTRTLMPGGKLTPVLIAKMRRDYQVSSCLTVQTLPLIRADWGIECDDDDAREYLTSAAELVMFDVLRSAGRALWAGFSPNTLTLTVSPDLGGLVWSEVRDLEPSSCKPLTDAAGTFRGFVQDEGRATEVTVDEIVTLWIVEAMESGNLYGRSVLDAALDPWSDKAAIRAFHARYLERFGEPVVKVRGPAGQSVANALEIAEAAAENPPREVPPKMVSNVDVAREIGENLRHHSVVAFSSDLLFGTDGKPAGFQWDVDYLEASRSGGSDFLDALREKDKAIARAIFVPDLLISNGETVGSNALGQSHRDVWTQSVEGRLDDYGRQITRQLLDPLRRWNFGDGAPRARLMFAPLADEDKEQLWEAAQQLIVGGQLTLDVAAIAARLGLPVAPPEETDTAANPFAQVGLPALVSSGIITRDEARELLNIAGSAPDVIDLPTPDPVAVAAMRRVAADADLCAALRTGLGLRPDPTVRERIELTAPPANVDGLPVWKLPQSFDPPPAYHRELNERERRVGFAKIEDGMNRAEARTVDDLVTILERERDRVGRQLTAIIRKATAADILAGLGSIELKGGTEVARAWAELMRDVSAIGLDALREELAAYAEKLPSTIGPAGEALVRSYATSASERVFAQLTTDLRFELLNAYTSSVSPAGMASVVAQVFDRYEGSEGMGPRLTTRMLSSKALNTSRADAVQRGGVPLRGAQYSAILDRRTCELCSDLDETVIPIEHTDLSRFTPPVHHNCRCVWVWITLDEADFTPTWSTPAASKVDRFGGLVF